MNQRLPKHHALHIKIQDLVQRGLHREALNHFQQALQRSSVTAIYGTVSPILPSLVKASFFCSHHTAFQLHGFAIKTALDTQLIVSNSLLSMYSKLGNVPSAHYVFDTMPHRDPISWNSMIMGFIQNGLFTAALVVFKEMCSIGYIPKPELIASVISLCCKIQGGKLKLGREIHGFVIGSGILISESVILSTAVVDLYMRIGDLSSAFHVFGQMKLRNEVSWTAMISGCALNKEYEIAMDCFRKMQCHGFKANRVTLLSVIPVCGGLGVMKKQAKEIYGYAFRHGFHTEPSFSAALVHMYSLIGRESSTAGKIMERTKGRDVVVWSSSIDSLSRDGRIEEAFRQFNQMRWEGIRPNSITLLAMFSACTNQTSMDKGGSIHSYALKSGFLSDISVGNSLLNMYAKCGSLQDSRHMFEELPMRDRVSWSSLINAYGLAGYGHKAVETFYKMKSSSSRVKIDSVALLSTLTACNRAGLVEEGQKLFKLVAEEKEIQLSLEHYSCQIDMLGRSGLLEEAWELMRQMPMEPSNKIRSSIVSASVEHGKLLVIAEKLANELIQLEPNNAANYTLLSMVYAKTGNWNKVEAIRRLMRENGLNKNRGFSKVGSICYKLID